jgi:hypothetical protein
MSEDQGEKRVEHSLARLADRANECRSLRPGDIYLHLSGTEGGEYRINHSNGKTTVSRSIRPISDRKSVLDVWGDANVVRAIIDGERDPVAQFLIGGLRIRGDLRYFSTVAVELGLLKQPL